MASLQFIGIDQIVKAFNYRQAELWAIFDGRRLIHKGEGADALREFLDMIAGSQTTATYILKIYDDLDDAKAIKSNTPDDGSFNFKLHQYQGSGEGGIVRRHYGDPVQAEILARLDGIEGKISGVGEPGEDDEDGFGEQLQTAVIGMLQDPNKLKNFLDIFRSSAPTGGALTGPYRPASVGSANPGSGSPAAPTLGGQPLTAESLQRIGDIIETLARHDPNIVEHLDKLAKLAERSPKKFSSILAIFDTTM